MAGGFFARAAGTAVALTIIGCGSEAAHAKADFSLVAEAPKGFDELEAPRQIVADIYFGNKLLGQTRVIVRPGFLKFADVSELARLLENVADTAMLGSILARELPANADRACSAMRTVNCGFLEPEDLAVIYHEDLLRVHVFFGRQFARSPNAGSKEYIAPSETGFSWVNSFGASLAGRMDGSPDYNLQSRTLIGMGQQRLRSNTSLSSDNGLSVDDFLIEADRNNFRLSAGLFWAPGTMLIGRRRILGAGIGSQFDTRIGQEQLRANPISVFVQQPAQVDLLVEGRLAWTQQLEPGNQLIDTSALPEGSYPVVIRIRESGRDAREEVRFLTKDRAVPPVGETEYHAFVGLLSPVSNGRALNVGDELFYQLGMGRRVGLKTSIEANLLGTSNKVVADLGLTHFTRFARVRVGALFSTNGERGASFQANSALAGPIDFSVDIRKVWGAAKGPIIPGSSGSSGFSTDGVRYSLAGGTNLLQANATLGYRLGSANVRLFANYFDTGKGKATYSIGPSFEWLAVQKSRFQLRLEADAQKSRNSSALYVGVRFLTVSGRLSVSGQTGFRTQRVENGAHKSDIVGNAAAEINGITAGGSRYYMAAGLDRGVDSTSARASTALFSDLGNFRADVLHSFGSSTNYSINANSGLVFGKDLNIGGRSTQESAVLVRVDGEKDAGSYEILVNEQVTGRVATGQATTVFLAPYRQYQVRLRPADGAAINFDAGPKSIALYPGNVERIRWSAVRTFTLYGQVVDTRGWPIPYAQMQGRFGVARSDDLGYFQIETASQEDLVVRPLNGQPCRLKFTGAPSADGLAAAGKVFCL